ncbi:MAG: hypothetical protein ACYCV7_13550 [Acidimicrobiales bacterium]
MSRPHRQPIRQWTGPERSYDLIFEGTVAVFFVAVLCVGAAVLFGSPDGGLTYPGGPPSKPGASFTARYWVDAPTVTTSGRLDPNGGAMDFATTVVAELAGTSTTATYGPPYNNTPGGTQHIGRVSLAGVAHAIFGLTDPVNTANDFVLAPLSQIVAPYDPHVAAAIRTYESAGGDLTPGVSASQLASSRQTRWLSAYAKALDKGSIHNGRIQVAPGHYGPVPTLVAAEMSIARNGSLDGFFRSGPTQVNTDTFRSTLFFSDGTLWGNIADAQGINGSQWGVMNELWSYPGQFWLVLYAAPYHIPAIASSSSGDLWVGTIVIAIGMILQLLLPWIPGLRDIPRLIPFYKVAYRRYYAMVRRDREPEGKSKSA